MIQSMTGFGKSISQIPNKKITVELKSLNSKNFDLNARIPSQYREKELELRTLISNSLGRGKVDLSIFVEYTGEQTSTNVNTEVVKAYMEQLKKLVDTSDVELLKMAVKMPDALKTEREEIDEEEFKAIEEAVQNALKEINNFRNDEGEALEKDLKLRIHNIQELLKQVIEMDPERVEAVRERLRKGIDEIKEQVDENRFEQELVYYIEKFDITEEKVRLENHLDYFLKTINSSESNGRKLAFISQEIGREINTIGSKSNFAPMQQLVVQMKDELEKIKEQILNVL
ncbi:MULTISPECIES: YicC/YloC family endoribonuclease [Christiangramia]|uniref:Protein YicC n=1 Tax=Christiangramia flava JLT2011 TaxID=1229726 RepID=A0A1L7I3U7_9FLAO|nr:YicC/YloC family endoribonuclease [Christiangramia flava]APU68266.1 Protein YicC [Christiangramia flava JLT2011]OSS40947.1 Protein YicC [Christiangramia flava JLT2011]